MIDLPSDSARTVRLRTITARPDVPFEWSEDVSIEHCPHSLQIESANDLWMPFEGIFTGADLFRPFTSESACPLHRAIHRAGSWALRNPNHPALWAIAAQMPFVHYLAAGPEVLHHDPTWGTITVPGIADDLTIVSDTAGRDIDRPTTSGGLIAVTSDDVGEHLFPDRPRIRVLHWTVGDETFDEARPEETLPEVDSPLGTVRSPVRRQLYTCALEYLATGEGMRVQILVVPAESEAAAKQRFLDHHYPGDPQAQEYFGRGVAVYPGVHRPILKSMVSESHLAHLEGTLRNGEFGLHYAFNLS